MGRERGILWSGRERGGGFVRREGIGILKGGTVSRALKGSGWQGPMRAKSSPARKDRSKGGSTVNAGEDTG